MSEQATKILNDLKDGNISEAIEGINAQLHEKSSTRIKQVQEEVAVGYGFNILESEEEEEEDDKTNPDSEEEEEEEGKTK